MTVAEYLILILIGTAITWVGLLIVIPIAQKLADFAMPPWPETLWKLAVVAGAVNVVTVLLDPVNSWLALLVGAGVFWALMVRWFRIDLFGAVIIVFLSWMLRWVLLATVFGSLIAAGSA